MFVVGYIESLGSAPCQTRQPLQILSLALRQIRTAADKLGGLYPERSAA